MSVTYTSKLLTEAAGVKIYMTEEHTSIDTITGKICIILKNIKEAKALGKSCGFHLTKSKWDPYPWINHIEVDSLADIAGLRVGDCLINIDGKDLLGLKIKQIAELIHYYQECNLKLSIWRFIEEEKEKETGIAVKGPLPEVACKLANAVAGVIRVLECPICLENSLSPVSQCVHGHIICVGCRSRTSRCPICRVRLGQGRCLLADKLNKIFRDIFDIKDNLYNKAECHTKNLRDRLFGKIKKKELTQVAEKTNGINSKTCQLLLTKLFRGGLEKAASADNLTIVSNEKSKANVPFINHIDERLNLYDRTKSASTGELSKERSVGNNYLQINAPNISSNNSLISNISPTLVWGDSIDSISCTQIICPLLKQSGCKNIITPDAVLEHLNEIHEVPQVHFYSICAKLPIPLPFGSEAVYILHYGEDLFFFQCENEIVWITSTIGKKTSWKWILYGQGENGTEIKICRNVASLVSPLVLSSQHTAPLPNALLLYTLNIQLIECLSHEQLEI
ncbi:uncharacterized protein LOC122713769 isoform X1 [Apis laboriosa]|uniref:uncharacterized protein LOC122713769 isoform X1 n=1 Tax=Apis laboriosa TaxID=183418 RepID=UPI001CC7D3DA|nr:uncharacterized protein LOC122713769 isoform X1 [Apis laboriosa]